MQRREIELLAPAGSFDCLQAAINAGADAVYFGVEQLNMRTRSTQSLNFSDIRKISGVYKAISDIACPVRIIKVQ